MNLKNIMCAMAFIMIASTAFSQKAKVQTVIFKVYGNCTQCKERIELSLDVKGVKKADWNIDTKQMEVVYVPAKITIEQIHALIAKSGHDTELAKAADSVYTTLPDCCLYREHPNTHKD
ncbi:MAG: heavy-metal-associated domain-containing protein [Bacteroidota bacterium]|nr:heavy-metal-associated domain-containing protein [Bacteroidota bacterium]